MAAGLRQLTERERAIVGQFRARHGAVRGLTQPIADDTGGIGMPLYRAPFLHRLEMNGDIGPRERLAGEEFARLFHLSQLDPLRAADMGRVSGGRPAGDLPPSGERARRLVSEAMAVLGGHSSPCAAAAWFVLGHDMTLRQWAQREGWSGRPIRDEIAKGALLGMLGVLASHFASTRPTRRA